MRPDASHDPSVKLVEELSDVGTLVILAPTSQERVQRFDQLLGRSLGGQILSVGAAAVAGLWLYARAVLVMRVPEAHQVHRLILTQLGRG